MAMDESMSGEEHSLDSVESSLPKRTLRKGTHSCAECKRRKTRCFFENPYAVICVGCQRRGTSCIGQEFVDIPLPDHGDSQRMAERLKRVEQILEKIIEKVFPDGSRNQDNDQIAGEFQRGTSANSANESLVPISNSTDYATKATADNSITVPLLHMQVEVVSQDPAEQSTDSAFFLPKYADTCRALYAALPSQQDANTLIGTGRATIFLQALCNSYSELFNEGNTRTTSTLAALPAVTVHPVILARKLLQFALCIQQLDLSFDQSVLHLGLSPRDAMAKYFNLATTMVTCHDDLLDSLEGLECIVLESVYLVNCGNLRRALVGLRRATTLIQLMGLHRNASHRALKQLDPATHISCEVAWAHIAYLERYLSLLLGIPSSIRRARFSSEEKTNGESYSEWFEKVQIDICDDIIDRNQSGNYNFSVTQNIDQNLNKMANSLPSEWWKPMDLHLGMGDEELMSRLITAQIQIIHYNVLTVLHLPYLLRSTPDHRFNYSKTSCIYASREVLSRFITFRSIVRVVFCCRPVDFCALTAAMTLLLAHLNGKRQASGWLLTHQRLSDRALIEKAVETMEELNRLNNDELSRETAKLTRKLLHLEAECAKGGDTYNCSVTEDCQDDNEGDRKHSFYLKIPYFGTVKLAREESFAAQVSSTESPSSSQLDNSYMVSTPASNLMLSSSFSSQQQHPALAQNAIGQPPGLLSGHTLQLPLQQHLVGNEHLPLLMSHPPITHHDEQALFDLTMPDIMAGADDWAFQGVDTAFFDSLINGNMASAVDLDRGWNRF